MRETSQRYDRPYRPAPVAAFNALGRWLPLGARIDPEALVARARRAEHLHDLGEPAWEQPLEQLCRSIRDEARLHVIGERVTFDRLVGLLRNRLRARSLRDLHPIDQQVLVPPLVITGLQRTGTTLLHRLLAADPRFRSLRSWEALNPAPYERKDERRRAHARRAERGLAWLAPDFFAVHPVAAESVEEEVLLLDHSLLSTVPEATLRVPGFSTWLEQQDPAPAYRMLADLLRLLQWQAPAERWLLKTPHHLEHLDALRTQFPGVRIVHTHRDPVVTVPSFCSMIAHGRGVFSEAVDPLEVGRDWSQKCARMVDRALASRDRDPSGILDVQYADLMADPMAVLERIYAFIDQPLTTPARAAIEQERAASPQHRFGRHVYSAAAFGLDESTLASMFAAYRERFGFA